MSKELSIIIPHKNSTKLLKRLLDSIPTSDVFQIIVIDDHSNDIELSRLKELCSSDCIELYENSGVGAGGARNTGLEHAKGKWLLFADSDDFFVYDINILLKRFKDSNFDVVYFKVTSCDSETLNPASRGDYINALFDKAKKKNDDYIVRCGFTTPWSKLIRRSLVTSNHIKFEEIPAGNDMMFSVMVGSLSKSVLIDDTCLYCVTISLGSITTTLSKDRFDSRFQATLRINDFLRTQNLCSYQASVLYYIGKSYIYGYKYAIQVFLQCLKHRSNLLIGASKFLNLKKTLNGRQNAYTLKK